MIALPDFSRMEDSEVRRLIADCHFHIGVFQSFLIRAEDEVKARRRQNREQQEEGSAPVVIEVVKVKPH